MILPDAPWRHRSALDRLVDALGADAGRTRYVGGAVRDTLLGLPVSDLDLATALLPEQVIEAVRGAGLKAIPTGLAHGTITALLPDGPVEVTTLRRDIATDGRHAEVAFTDDWRADAARRDFTINALSADPRTGVVHDYFDGLSDLADGRVRFIGDPRARIAEDHLRILRFFRFHARFGLGAPDAEGLAACTARARDLMALSRERIAQELLKLLAARDPAPTVAIMVAHAILAPVLPEIDASGVAYLSRLIAREERFAKGDPLRRLAALLPSDAAVAESVARRLKLSNAQRRRLMLAAGPVSGSPRALAYRVGVESARDRLLLHADEEAAAAGLSLIENWQPARLPLGGGELVALGLPRGPIIAATLAAIESDWVDEGFPEGERFDTLVAHHVDQALRER